MQAVWNTLSMRGALAALVLAATPALAGDFVDLRLSFNVTDENVLVKPGETVPSIPGVRIGTPIPRWGSFFFDQYDTRYTGFENLTNLVLYKQLSLGQDDFEGAFILRFSSLSDNLSSLYDGGSYIKWTHWLDPAKVGTTNVNVTAFPFSADMFRLGYSYKISWGGSPIFFKTNPDNPYAAVSASNTTPAPGIRFAIQNDKFYGFVGGKTSLLLNQAVNEQQAIYGLLAGGGYEATRMVRVEANGGYFYRGVNPIEAVLGKPVQTAGISAQVTVHDGAPVGRADELRLYKNDPSSAARLFQPEEYPGGLSWMVSAEGTYVGTTLENADKPANTIGQPGFAGDINVRVKWNKLRLHADFTFRDLSFMLLNVPSFVPFQAFSPTQATITPDMFGSVGADYFFEPQHLTLGLTAGIEMPATFKGNLPASFVNDLPADALPASSSVAIRSEGVYDILPPGYGVVPVYAAKIHARFTWSAFSVLAEILAGYDNNVTHLQRINNDPQQVSTRVFNNPGQLGFNVALQARL
jgi:hypothetical protein